ncbi:MAG: hypothetical protein R6V27_03475 [Balneolaceae bacterium]
MRNKIPRQEHHVHRREAAEKERGIAEKLSISSSRTLIRDLLTISTNKDPFPNAFGCGMTLFLDSPTPQSQTRRRSFGREILSGHFSNDVAPPFGRN